MQAKSRAVLVARVQPALFSMHFDLYELLKTFQSPVRTTDPIPYSHRPGRQFSFGLVIEGSYVIEARPITTGSCAGQWQQAILLLESMAASTIQPTVLSYAAAISCTTGGPFQVVDRLLSALKVTFLSSL